jgi:hypothetical protein
MREEKAFACPVASIMYVHMSVAAVPESGFIDQTAVVKYLQKMSLPPKKWAVGSQGK